MSVRIYQLARQLNMENKKVLELLQKRGMDVKSPSSTIPNLYAEEFLKEFQNQGYDVIDITNDIAPGEHLKFSLKLIRGE